jgi:hypothetical protein
MSFKSGLIHILETDILQITTKGQIHLKVTYGDGSRVWVIYSIGSSLADAQALAYERFNAKFRISKEATPTAADHVERLYAAHAKRQDALQSGKRLPGKLDVKFRRS